MRTQIDSHFFMILKLIFSTRIMGEYFDLQQFSFGIPA